MKRLLCIFLISLLPFSVAAEERQGNNGMSHGLVLAGALAATWVVSDKLFPNNRRVGDVAVTVVALVGAQYFYERERKARNGADFDDWSFDSQADAVVPFSVSLFAIRYRFK